jgi:hypothetical protein
MNINLNNCFSDDDTFPQLNSNIKEFDDILSYSFMKEYNDVFEPKYDIDLHKNYRNEIIPSLFKENTKKTKEESNKDEDFIKADDDLTHNTNSDYKKKVDNIQVKMRENIYSKMPFRENTNKGRKTKLYEGLGKHNKFSDDNLIKKIKNMFKKSFTKFINKKISTMYSQNDSNNSKNKQLYKLSQKQGERSKTEYNKSLLNRTLQSVFSEDISTKYKIKNPNYNKELIEKLLNEKDENKRLTFQKIFNLTFIESLKHFRGSIFINELSEMKTFKDYLIKKDFGKNSKEYREILIIYMNNFEKIVMEKRSRKNNKKYN